MGTEQSQPAETKYILKDHVLQEMEKRDIPPELVKMEVITAYRTSKINKYWGKL